MPDWLKSFSRHRRRSRSSDSHDRPPSTTSIPLPSRPRSAQPQPQSSTQLSHNGSVPTIIVDDSEQSASAGVKPVDTTKQKTDVTLPSKKFKRNASDARDDDLKRLAIAYLLEENSDLRTAIILIDGLRHPGGNTKKDPILEDVAGFAAKFVLELAELDQVGGVDLSVATTEFLSALREFNNTLNQSPPHEDTLKQRSTLFKGVITAIRQRHVSILNHDFQSSTERWHLGTLIDVSLTVLDTLKDGCELVPAPYLKPAVGLAIGLLKAVKQTRSNYDDMRRIADIAGEFVLSLAVICSDDYVQLSDKFKASLDKFTMTLEEIGGKCYSSSEKSLLYRFIQQGAEKDKVSDLRLKLDQAITVFQNKTHVLQQGDIQRIKDVVQVMNEKMDMDLVNMLPKHPYYTGRKQAYMVGSRDDVMERIATWIEGTNTHILWLRGAAGMGKSTIAHQIVYSLTDSGRLATYFFFTSGSSDQSDPVAVIKTMARELSSLHPITTAEVAKAIRAPQSSHESLSAYLEQYITSPIRNISTSRSFVIVLDAVNEWVNHPLFLEALKEVTQVLSGIKFIITSRPEKRIADALAELPVTTIVLDKVDMPIMKEYFTRRFKDISWNNRRPSDREIERLATVADGLLIWAATLCEYISNDMEEEPHRLLEQILTSTSGVSSEKQLTTLYQTTPTHLFGDGTGKDADHFRRLFGIMSVIQESLKVSDFDNLMNTKSARLLENILSRLSALKTRGDDVRDTISPATEHFHGSFLDFSTSQDAPSHLRISTSEAHSNMAEACLRTLSQFFKAPKERRRMNRHVSYATENWAFHFSNAAQNALPTDKVFVALKQFLGDPLHSWIQLELQKSELHAEQVASISLNEDNDELLHWLVEHEQGCDNTSLSRWIHFEQVAIHLNGKAKYYTRLGSLYNELFKSTLMITPLNDAVDAYRKALTLGSDRSLSLNNLALALFRRFKEQGSVDDLNEAITMHTEALHLRPSPHLHRSTSLNNLAYALFSRFDQQGSIDDLEEAITMLREALELCPSPHPSRSISLTNLANALIRRYEQQGSVDYLEEAITMFREALELCPSPHPNRALSLMNLAISLFRRFEQQGSVDELNEAIIKFREALELCPSPHPNRSSSLNNLANALSSRFRHQGSVGDLDEAIRMHREALELYPSPHPDRSWSLVNLALGLFRRFERQGSVDDLNEAIAMYIEALELCPFPHPKRSMSLDGLAQALFRRFEQQGSVDDLDEAITLHREFLELCSYPHPNRSMSLNGLAMALVCRFGGQRSVDDLNEAIILHTEALELRPYPHPDRSLSLDNLGIALYSRFEQLRSVDDLNEAITMHRESLGLRPHPHPNRSSSLNNLANALFSRFQQQKMIDDLNEAITLHRKSLELRPHRHPRRSSSLINLAMALFSRFQQQESVDDLNEAISMYGEALDMCPSPKPQRSSSLNGLAIALFGRFKQQGSVDDKNKAIAMHREALKLRPSPHPQRWVSLSNLSTALMRRYEITGSEDDLKEATSLRSALNDKTT